MSADHFTELRQPGEERSNGHVQMRHAQAITALQFARRIQQANAAHYEHDNQLGPEYANECRATVKSLDDSIARLQADATITAEADSIAKDRTTI